MELLISSKLAHSKFHGIQLNCSCEISQLKFHGIPWNSMDLIVSVKLAHSKFHRIPWFVLIEPFVSSIRWVLNLDRIPWNLSFQILMKIIFNFAGWINFSKFISTLYLLYVSYTNLCFIINICITPHAFPWNFLNNIRTTPEVPWNSTELKQQNLKFHGIPWNLVVIQSSMEFHGIFFP